MLPTNKTIWMFWDQGFENAPELVKKCVESWKYFNPEYKINLLDHNNLADYCDLKNPINFSRSDLTIQAKSELIRLALLQKYGGVWTDATVFCTLPLNDWLPEYYNHGYFAFRNPGPDRLISTWFIASEKNNAILIHHYQEFLKFFSNTYFFNKNKRAGNSLTHHLTPLFDTSPKQSLFWHSFFAKKFLRVYPYYICHYTFNKIILRDKNLAELWNASKSFEADIPHVLQQLCSPEKNLDKALYDIENKTSPVYKFDRRRDYNAPYWGGILKYLEKTFIKDSGM